MRDYGKVAPTFWLRGSGKLLRGHPSAQILALYLFTAPGASMTGLYYLALPSVCHETGLDDEEIAEALDKLEEIGVAFYDDDAELVWVPEMARYQIGDALDIKDKRGRGVEREIAIHQGHPFFAMFVAKYKEAYSLATEAPPAEPWKLRHRKPHGSPFQGPTKPHGSQELSVLVPDQDPDPGSLSDPYRPTPGDDPETAGARVASPVPAQGCLLPVGKPTQKPATKRVPAEPAEVRYARAFADGQLDAGAERFTPPTDSGAQHAFRTGLKTHALDADSRPLREEAVLAWIRAKSAEYRRAKPSDGDFGGFTPRKMFMWLDGGARAGPGGRAPSASTQQTPPPEERLYGPIASMD